MCCDAHAASASSGWPVTSPPPTVFISSATHVSVAVHEQRAERVLAISACGGRQLEATAEVGDVDGFHSGVTIGTSRSVRAVVAVDTSVMSTETTTSAETERVFRRLVANTLMTGVTSSFLWFAVTFWVYLETRSVVATGVIGAAFGLSSALIGPAFGTFVDRHRKHWSMVVATAVSAGVLRRRHRRLRRRRRRHPARARQSVVLDADRPHPARLGRRPDARHRPVDVRHAARAGRPARPGQRPGRHGHRCLLRHHVGVQRVGDRPPRAWAGRSTARSPSSPSPSCTS